MAPVGGEKKFHIGTIVLKQVFGQNGGAERVAAYIEVGLHVTCRARGAVAAQVEALRFGIE